MACDRTAAWGAMMVRGSATLRSLSTPGLWTVSVIVVLGSGALRVRITAGLYGAVVT